MKYKLNFKKYILAAFVTGIVIICGLVLFAFARTWGKTEIQFKIHINEELVKQSTFGESPTFAIWIEDPGTKKTQTVFVTNRAGTGDWEGKADVPDALPKWFAINKAQNSTLESTQQENTETDAITGAGVILVIFISLISLGEGVSQTNEEYYTAADFQKMDKIDSHCHINTTRSDFMEVAVASNFRVLAINTDAFKTITVGEQQDIANFQHKSFPGNVAWLCASWMIDGEVKGLKLPCEVIEKIYYKNAEKLFPEFIKLKP